VSPSKLESTAGTSLVVSRPAAQLKMLAKLQTDCGPAMMVCRFMSASRCGP